jgi:hypothetical protein
VFTFTAENSNDLEGDPDFALAGLEIAPIPLPAGTLPLGTAILGLGQPGAARPDPPGLQRRMFQGAASPAPLTLRYRLS